MSGLWFDALASIKELRMEPQAGFMAFRFFAESVLRKPSLPVRVLQRSIGCDLVWLDGRARECLGVTLSNDAGYQVVMWRTMDHQVNWLEYALTPETEQRFWNYLGILTPLSRYELEEGRRDELG